MSIIWSCMWSPIPRSQCGALYQGHRKKSLERTKAHSNCCHEPLNLNWPVPCLVIEPGPQWWECWILTTRPDNIFLVLFSFIQKISEILLFILVTPKKEAKIWYYWNVQRLKKYPKNLFYAYLSNIRALSLIQALWICHVLRHVYWVYSVCWDKR